MGAILCLWILNYFGDFNGPYIDKQEEGIDDTKTFLVFTFIYRIS